MCVVSIDSGSCHSWFVALCLVTFDCELIDGVVLFAFHLFPPFVVGSLLSINSCCEGEKFNKSWLKNSVKNKIEVLELSL